MIFGWLRPSMPLTIFLAMTCSGASNGSAVLVTARVFPATPYWMFALAQLPAGEMNPLSARSRSCQTKRTAKVGVGLLPYISTASVWQRHRPVLMNLAASRHRLCIDTSSCRTLALADVANAIPRSNYLFGVSWPDVRRTLLVAVEQEGDPYAVMIPTTTLARLVSGNAVSQPPSDRPFSKWLKTRLLPRRSSLTELLQ